MEQLSATGGVEGTALALVLVAAALAFAVASGLWILLARVRATARAHRDRLALAGAAPLAQDGANCLGHDRSGRPQVRGHGSLVLASDRIGFLLAVPRRGLVIPLADVRAVRAGDRFARPGFRRRSRRDSVLEIEVAGAEGPWRAGWEVPGAAEWVRRIEAATGERWLSPAAGS